jgi:hypothetical protein
MWFIIYLKSTKTEIQRDIMITFTEEEFEALTKKIFAAGVRSGYHLGLCEGESGIASRYDVDVEKVWEDEVQYLREIMVPHQMDISKIEDWEDLEFPVE